MKNIITYKSLIYYNYCMDVELAHKSIKSKLADEVLLSTVLTRKNKNVESSSVKMNRLIESISAQRPEFYLTTSFVNIRATISKSRLNNFFLFIQSYLHETGRYTLSPISALGNQANFTITDYVYLSNFLTIGYDYFNWRFPLRFTINFSSMLDDKSLKFFFHLLIFNHES